MSHLNIYRHRFLAQCPVDGAQVLYSLTIDTNAVLMAEDIEAACRFEAAVFHEDVADKLLVKFGGKQTLAATHGKVEIETLRGA